MGNRTKMVFGLILISIILVSGCINNDSSETNTENQEVHNTMKCEPDWQCEQYSQCPQSGVSWRECVDINRCDEDNFVFYEYRECAPHCVEDWSCSKWSECWNFTQYRSCTDKNDCGTFEKKPKETLECELHYTVNLKVEDDIWKIEISEIIADEVDGKLSLRGHLVVTNMDTKANILRFTGDVLDNMGGQYDISLIFGIRFMSSKLDEFLIEEGYMHPGVTRLGGVQFPPLPLETKHVTYIETLNSREYRFDIYLE